MGHAHTHNNNKRNDSIDKNQMNLSQIYKQDFPNNLQEYQLPQYGGQVIVNKEERIVMKPFKVSIDEEDLFCQVLEKRLKLKHKNLASILDYQECTVQGGQFCTPQNKIYLLQYDLCAFSLFHQLKNWCKLRKNIPEKQICRIFTQVAECLEYLRENKTLHGDIKTSSIFLDKTRRVKLIDSFFVKKGKTAFEVVLQDPLSMSLLAPEQLDILKQKRFNSLSNAESQQVFMVGLTMIEATTVRQGMCCYNLERLEIRQQFFASCMKDIMDCGYSYQLANLIMNCVQKNPSMRPTFRQFLKDIYTIAEL